MSQRFRPEVSIRPRLRAARSASFPTLVLVTSIGLAAGAAAATDWSEREQRYQKFIDFPSMVMGGTVRPHWMEDGNRFWYAAEGPDDTTYFMVDCEAGTRESIPGPPETGSDAGTPPADTDRTNEDVAETPSPGGRWFIAVKKYNLWYRAADAEELVPLTTDGVKDHAWSVDEVQWAADGDRFAVQRYDARNVHKMPVVTWLGHEESVEWRPYSYAEGPTYQPSIHVVDLTTGSVTRVDTGAEADQTLVLLEWRPDGSEVMLLHLTRGMKRIDLMAADPATGAARAVVSDRQATFIEGLHFFFTYDAFYRALDDGEHFIWRSERDGWAHFYLYRNDGTLVRRLTAGEWEVGKVLAVDGDGGWVYFTAQADTKRPYDRHLYRVDLEGERMEQLTAGAGLHGVTIAPAMTGFIDNHSSVGRKPSSELRGMDGSVKLSLAEADISALEAMGWKPPEEFVVKAADGRTDIYGVMYKPHDFDPARKYPVIEIIYAGSLMTAVPNRFVPREYGHFAQVLAQLNFITVVVDGRGTPGRGKAFQDAVYRSIGRVEIPDHAAALRQLAAERPYMDMARVGVHGKSWGGYFALRAMLQAPDVYHVGVASAVVADLATTAYSPVTPYMEYPDENPEGYDYANCLEWADKLEGKLLITAATGDVNTPFAQTMKMVEAFIQADKPVDLMVFPDQHHWLQGESLDYFYQVLKNYFVEHLTPEGSR